MEEGSHYKKIESPYLTPRMIEVLRHACLRNPDIAQRLNMKLRTAEKHIETILATLHVDTRTAALIVAIKKGIITIDEVVIR